MTLRGAIKAPKVYKDMDENFFLDPFYPSLNSNSTGNGTQCPNLGRNESGKPGEIEKFHELNFSRGYGGKK